MTAPIRSMGDLVAAARTAQIERGLSDQVLEALAGLASGSVAKYLAPNPSKKLGPISTFPLFGALGKCLVVVDDPEMIQQVRGRWKRRHVRGGAAMQMAELASRAGIGGETQENLETQAQLELRERMKALSKLGASKGGKRRMKLMGKRARQRMASHAARKRWSKEK